MSENISYNKIIEKLVDENEEQKEIINNYRNQNFELREDLGTYKNQYNKLFDENKQLKKNRKRWIKEYINFKEKCSKLSNELTLKIRHNHIQTLEINELKRELKEYRGF